MNENIKPKFDPMSICPTCGQIRPWVQCETCDGGRITEQVDAPLWQGEYSWMASRVCQDCEGYGGGYWCAACAASWE
jgi:DnaJ-class molecular chaperone